MSNSPSDVGYRRPPAKTRFRPGLSGNPSGRPKRRPSFREALLAELATAMPGKDPQRAGSKLQAVVKTLVDSAIAGDARSQALLVGAMARLGQAEEPEAATATEADEEQRSSEDREIVDAFTPSPAKRRDI